MKIKITLVQTVEVFDADDFEAVADSMIDHINDLQDTKQETSDEKFAFRNGVIHEVKIERSEPVNALRDGSETC